MQQMCQKLRQMRQKVGNRQMFMKAIAFPNLDDQFHETCVMEPMG